MRRPMAPSSTPANRFDILDEEGLDARPLAPRHQYEDVLRSPGGVLAELSVDHSNNQSDSSHHNQPRSRRPASFQSHPDTASPKAAARGSHRRPIIETDTFEPLASVDEESGLLNEAAGEWSIQQQQQKQQQHPALGWSPNWTFA